MRSQPSSPQTIFWIAVSRPSVQRPRLRKRPAAEIDHVGFAVLRFDEIGVAGALQLGVGPVARAQDVGVGMQFVGPGQIARARHRHGVVPAGAAFGGEQVIPAVALVEMRRFGEAERRAFENVHALADQLAFLDRVFLQHDSGEAIAARADDPRAC